MIKEILGFKVQISYKKNMKTIKFRFVDGVIVITCPKVPDKKIESFIKDNYEQFNKQINNSIKTNEYTYIQGVKYNIVNITEPYNNILFDEEKLLITKGYEEKLIKEFFVNDVQRYIKSKEEEFKRYFNNMPTFIVKSLKSSFGQYNKQKHTVTLDYRLAKYERIFLYLTLAHEMCHIIHFDHSKEFYELLDTFVPNSKQMHKIMRKIKMDDIF